MKPQPHLRSFWLIAVANGVVMFGSAAPSPLYPVYQQLWHFSAAMLTIVFAVYVAGLLISLLTLGRLSDHVGRKPVLIGSLIVLIGAMALFATATGVGFLLAARLVQGLATGAALGALSAALVDMQPSRRVGSLVASIAPIAGLGLGIIVCSVLVQYGPDPHKLVFELIAAVLVIFAVATAVLVPETSPRTGFHSRAHLAKVVTPQVSVPREVRSIFIAGIPALVATWALGGLALSLGSSIIAAQLKISNIAVNGLVLCGFFFAAALAAPYASHPTRPIRLPHSYAALAVGLALQLSGSLSGSTALYLVGLLSAGIGFSTAYVGVIASLANVDPAERGRVFAAIYVVSYVAFSVPALVGGFAATDFGLRTTTTGYVIFDLLMVALAAAFIVWPRTRTARTVPGTGPTGPVAPARVEN